MKAGRFSLALRASPALVVFCITFAVRLVVLVRFSHSLHFVPEGDDMRFYNDWGLRILHGQWTDGKAFYGLPGYAYLLAAIYKLLGGFNPFAVGLIQSAIEGVISVFLYKIPVEIVSGHAPVRAAASRQSAQWIGIGAALAWTFFLPVQAFSIILMPTVWLVCAFYGSLYLLLRVRSTSWWNPWLAVGILTGAVAMLVATILFLVPVFLVSIALTVARGSQIRERIPKIACAAIVLTAGIAAGASPAWLHNYFIAREPVMLSAHSGINFWIGNNPSANGYPKMPPGIRATQDGLLRDSITLAEQQSGRKLARYEVSRFWSEQANRYVRENRPAWLRLMLTKLANFWNAYQYDDLSIIKLLREDGILLPGIRFGIVAALGLASFVPVCLRFPRACWIAAGVLLHMCALMSVFVTERYRLAAVPGLMILGGFGLWMLWDNVVRSRWLAVAGFAAASIAAGWFVSIPRTEPGLWSLDHYKAGIRATTAGDLDRAQRNLETAYAYVPDNADINFALGNVWLARSEREPDQRRKTSHRARALSCYRRAMTLEPKHAGTLNNLGVLAMEESRWDVAEAFLGGAAESEPESAKVHYLLARVRFEKKDFAGARKALDTALALRPEQREFLELRDKLATAAPQ